MYNYQLIRNHYVVSLDGDKYFIDTGCPYSYSRNGAINIDGRRFRSNVANESMLTPMGELIGASISGLIGLDILSKTSLTIYKDGNIDFAPTGIEGIPCPFVYPNGWPIGINCVLENGEEAVAVIDTGAMIYYGKYPECFNARDFVGEFDDYNPQLGKMRSKFFMQTIQLAGRRINISVGDSSEAAGMALRFPGAALVMNVTELFDDAIVFDFAQRKIIVQ